MARSRRGAQRVRRDGGGERSRAPRAERAHAGQRPAGLDTGNRGAAARGARRRGRDDHDRAGGLGHHGRRSWPARGARAASAGWGWQRSARWRRQPGPSRPRGPGGSRLAAARCAPDDRLRRGQPIDRGAGRRRDVREAEGRGSDGSRRAGRRTASLGRGDRVRDRTHRGRGSRLRCRRRDDRGPAGIHVCGDPAGNCPHRPHRGSSRR